MLSFRLLSVACSLPPAGLLTEKNFNLTKYWLRYWFQHDPRWRPLRQVVESNIWYEV